MRRYLLLLPLLAGMLVVSPAMHSQQDEVIYHVVQRSFYDSNGDLHGDLIGLREKLDYLHDLGVTSILLLPLYNSEFYHNYFATDFETIDSEFGTMEDYLALVSEVHARGMKLYMDMETQYVTEDHLWYRDSYHNPDSPYSGYIVYNGPGNTDPESIIFNLDGLEGYDGTYRKITTVNLNSKNVLKYNIDLFRHWVDPNGDGEFSDGVDGFRLDHMMDDLDWKGKFTDLFAQFWSPLISSVKQINPNVIFIAEQARWESWGTEYLEQAGVAKVFGFNLFRAIASFNKERIQRAADSTFSLTDDNQQFVVFIENHDINRFASAVEKDPGKLQVAAALNLLLGGTPSIYYGQEIGMSGEGGFGKFGSTDGNDIPMREAFEWYAKPSGAGMALWYKDTGPWWDQTNLKENDGVSLEEQLQDPVSLWHTYQGLLSLRKRYPALVSGRYQSLPNSNPYVVSFARITTSEHLVVIINLTAEVQEADLDHPYAQSRVARSVYGVGMMRLDDGTLGVELPGYGVMVVKVQ